MPKYLIKSPDGKSFEVSAPEGATQDQVLNYAKQQFEKRNQKREADLAEDREKYAPTVGMSGADKFFAGAGKAFTDLGRGVGQLAGFVSEKDVDESRKLDQALMQTGAGMAGNITGNVAATLPTMFMPGVNTVTGGAALGTTLGAIGPVGTDESRLKNAAIGGAFGLALPAAVNVAKAGKAALYDPLAGQAKIIGGALTRAAGDKASEIVKALRGQGAATKGVQLSAGTVSRNEGLSALEDAIRSQLPSGELARIGQTNRNALADALRGIADTPEAMAAAQAAREGAAESLYGRAFQSDAMRKSIAKEAEQAVSGLRAGSGNFPKIDLSTEGLRALQSRPMFQSAMEQAKKLAADKGANIGNPLESLEGLHYIKLALDDMANPLAGTAMGKNQLSAVNSIRSALTKELENVSPLYGNARSAFAEMSQPINQMQVGQSLANKLIPATADEMPASLNYAQLAKAMQDPDAVARAATGFEGAKMASILSPDQMGTVQGVTSDASRIAEALRRGMGTGSPTARRLAQGDMVAQHFAQEAPITSRILEIAGTIPGVNLATKGASAIGSMVGDKINAQMLGKLDEMLANNPQGVAQLIEKELMRIAPTERQKILRALPQSVVLGLSANVTQ